MDKKGWWFDGGAEDFVEVTRGSLVCEHVRLDLKRLREKAQRLLEETSGLQDEDQKLEALMKAIGNGFFQGAHREATAVDDQIAKMSFEMPDEYSFNNRIPSVISASIKYLREFPREGGAHRARLSSRNNDFRKSVLAYAEAWERRGKQV